MHESEQGSHLTTLRETLKRKKSSPVSQTGIAIDEKKVVLPI